MIINAIYAVGKNGEMGMADGNLPWTGIEELKNEAKKDMQNFKNLTTGNIIIMGYNTYKTFNKPLPNRMNIVINRFSDEITFSKEDLNDENILTGDKWYFAPSLEHVISKLDTISSKEIYIIGGAKLLHQAFSKKIINGRIFKTVFDYEFPAATVFFTEEYKN